jgi:hypothetical protein
MTKPERIGVQVPLWAFMAVFLVLLLIMTASFTARRGGVLYPLDDPYIHLALGRTIAETGVWGLLPDRPSAASSSPLWTVLLAMAAKITPGMTRTAFSWVPLIGNLVVGMAMVAFWRRKLANTPFPNTATLLLIAIVPLPTIALIGMEHVLHAYLASLLAWAAAQALEEDAAPSGRQLAVMAALSALAVAARYESMALVVTIAAISIYYRKPAIAPAVLLPAVVVIAAFGWIWVRNGGWWVPNSLLLKTDVASGGNFIANLLTHLVERIREPTGLTVKLLIIILALYWLRLRRRRGPERVLLFLALACAGAQFVFGQLGWLFRYEAWLIALGGLAVLLAANVEERGRPWLFPAVAMMLLLVCAPRTLLSLTTTLRAAHDREWEHFGPADALAPLAGKTMLVNDIGVITYYGTMHPVDVYGLADNDSLRLKRARRLDPTGTRDFARSVNARYGEFQICWKEMRGHLPAGWTLVEAWTGPRNVVFQDLTIGFMAEPGRAAAELEQVLAKSPVPAGVRRFDASSAFVQAFNADPDKTNAAIKLCSSAALLTTGKPDASPVE